MREWDRTEDEVVEHDRGHFGMSLYPHVKFFGEAYSSREIVRILTFEKGPVSRITSR